MPWHLSIGRNVPLSKAFLARSGGVGFLFDHGTPNGLVRALGRHTVITAQATGWDRPSNSELLDAAETAAVDQGHGMSLAW